MRAESRWAALDGAAWVLAVVAMLVLGVASIPLQHLMPETGAINALEWSYSVLMLAFFPLTGEAWRLSSFRMRLELDP